MKQYLMDAEKCRAIALKAFLAMGYGADEAEGAARVIATADARGVDTHGLARLEMYYELWNKPGIVNRDAKLTVLKETPCSAYFDAQDGLGPIMAPFGGCESVLGNSPWSLAFPKGNQYNDYVMLDMACANASFGKLQAKVRAGESMPDSWGVNANGEPTTDPNDILDHKRGGALIAFGGAKGSCLAVMIEFLSAVLSGAGYAPDSGTGTYFHGREARRENLGHFMLAIDPTLFRPIEELRADIDRYADMIHKSRPRTGSTQVYLPGELESIAAHKREREGVQIPEAVMESVLRVYCGLGLAGDGDGIDAVLTP